MTFHKLRITLSYFFLVFFILFPSCKKMEEDPKTKEIYFETLNYAREKNLKLILVFGADWCKDCRSLKDRFVNHPNINSLINSNFVVLNIDVGQFDKNLEFAQNFGSPQEKGIPSLVIIDPSQNDKILASTNAGEFSNASNMNDESIENYLKKFIE
ncbi:MAG: thioredoxin family protein [Leptospiraceae bacterium]|nr:thioredoxin family protein [Leptospiraceae bacterium]